MKMCLCRAAVATIAIAAFLPLAAAQTTNAPPRIVTGAVAFARHVLDNTVDQTHAVAAADFDRDGWVDVVATDFVNGAVVWYRNDTQGGFKRVMLDPALAGAYPVGVGDVDRDGNPDVVAAGYDADLFVWYRNDGRGNFTRHNVGSSDGAHSIVVVDLDRDGDMDLVTTSQDANQVGWYENNGKHAFTARVIDTQATGAKRAEVADLDGDGYLDIVAASFFANEVAWYRNDGSQRFTKRVIDGAAKGAYYVFPSDLDGDGNVDVLAASQLDNEVVWHRGDGRGGFTSNVIEGRAMGARTVIAADVDGDGDPDVVTATVDDDRVAWYENCRCSGLRPRSIDSGALGAYGVDAIDIDGDGDIDLLSASRDDDTVALHVQLRRHSLSVTHAGRRVIDASTLMTLDADDGPGELLYTVAALPAHGRLELNGRPLAANGTFTQADIDGNRVVYVHHGASAADRFAFTVRDGGENGVRPAAGEFEVAVAGARASLVELPLDEGTGTIARDVSGHGHHAQLVNGATFVAQTPDGSRSAVRLDGQDDYLDLGAFDVTGPGLTLAVWFQAQSFPGPSRDPRLISKASGTSEHDHVFMLSTVGVGPATLLRARVRVASTTTNFVAPRGELRTGVWHHAAATHDGHVLRLYLDGVEVGAVPLSGTVDVDATVSVCAGAQPPSAGARFFDGLLDDVRILNRAMHAGEIAALALGCGRLFRSYGAGLAGTGGVTPRLDGAGCPRLGGRFSIDVARGPAGAPGIVVLGDRASIPMLGGWLLATPVFPFPVKLVSSGACLGSASLPLHVPLDAGLAGMSLYWQGAILDLAAPAGVSLTAGLETRIER